MTDITSHTSLQKVYHKINRFVFIRWHLGSCNMKYTPVNRGFDTFYGFFDALEDYYSHRVEYNVSDVLFSGLDSWNQTSEYLEPILDKNNTFSQVSPIDFFSLASILSSTVFLVYV